MGNPSAVMCSLTRRPHAVAQVRFSLPMWLGVGVALKESIDGGHLPVLKDMYEHWPFFQSTIDLVEMVMAKSDLRIAKVSELSLKFPAPHRPCFAGSECLFAE